MAGVSLELESEGLDRALRGLRALSGFKISTALSLSEDIGALVEGSVKRRVANEKAAPDGTAWAPWSDAYGATRKAGQSKLQSDGDLQDSIQFVASASQLQVGSNLIYAAIHQVGGEEVGIDIPARPYLGLNARDEADIEALVHERLGGVFA